MSLVKLQAQQETDYFEISPRPFASPSPQPQSTLNQGFRYAKPPPRPTEYQHQNVYQTSNLKQSFDDEYVDPEPNQVNIYIYQLI